MDLSPGLVCGVLRVKGKAAPTRLRRVSVVGTSGSLGRQGRGALDAGSGHTCYFVLHSRWCGHLILERSNRLAGVSNSKSMMGSRGMSSRCFGVITTVLCRNHVKTNSALPRHGCMFSRVIMSKPCAPGPF